MSKRLLSLLLALSLLIGGVFAGSEDIVTQSAGESEAQEVIELSAPAESQTPEDGAGETNGDQAPEADDSAFTQTQEEAPAAEAQEAAQEEEPAEDASEQAAPETATEDASDGEENENEADAALSEGDLVEENGGETSLSLNEDNGDDGDIQDETPATETENEEPAQDESADEIDYTRSCKYSPAFTGGYVELREGAELYDTYYNAEPYAKVKKGVAYVTSRVNAGGSNDKLHIAYADAQGEYEAYVSASAATPLTDKAVESFKAALPEDNDHFADARRTIPLAELTVIVLEKDTDEEGEAQDTVQDTVIEETNEETSENDTDAPEATDETEQGEDGTAEGETDKAEPAEETDSNDEQAKSETENTETENKEDTTEDTTEPAEETPAQDETETTETEPINETDNTEIEPTNETDGTETEPADETDNTETEPANETEPADEEIIISGEATYTEDAIILSAYARTTVAGETAAIRFGDFGDKVGVGDTLTVSAYTVDINGEKTDDAVTFSIDGGSASMSGSVISGKTVGSFTLVAESGEVKASMSMRVTAAPSAITMDQSDVTVGVNGTAVLTYSVNEGSAGSATWASSDESVAKVSKNGVVTGVAPGTAVITATTYNGLSDSCAVSVMSEPDDLKLNVTAIELSENETVRIDAGFTGDVFGNVHCEDVTGDAEIELTALGGGSFSLKGVLSGKASVLFYVYNKTSGQTYTARLDVTVKPAVTRIEIAGLRETIGQNEVLSLQPTAYDGRGNIINEEIRLSVSNTKVLALNGMNLTGKSTGKATVTATSAGGVENSAQIQVVKAPTSLKLNVQNAHLSVGEEVQLAYEMLPKGSASAITFASSNEGVVTVDENGLVKAVGAGNATITVSTYVKKAHAVCNVDVVAAPQGVRFEQSEYTIIEDTKLATALVFTPVGAEGAVSYTTSDDMVVSVDENGVLTGLNTGSATIRVEARSSLTGEIFTATATVTVTPAPARIELGDQRSIIGKGETLTLVPKAFDKYGEPVQTGFAFTSDKPKTVGVNEEGVFKGLNTGTANITVTADNGCAIKLSVKVVAAPTKVQLNKKEVELSVGETTTVEYKLNPTSAATEITWTSSNETVATVENGVISAHAAGTATIRCATYLDKVFAEVQVTVYAAPVGISFSSDTLEIKEGESMTPAAVLAPSSAQGDIVYELSFPDGEEIASYDGKTVKALLSGNAVLTAKVFNYDINDYVTCSATLKIVPAVQSIVLRSDRNSIGLKETVDLKPVAYDARGREIDAEIRLTIKGGYVKLVEGTTVFGNSKGTSTITAAAENGVKIEKKYSVVDAPKKVKIVAPALQVAVGETMLLKAQTVNKGDDTADVTWTSSDESVFTVSPDGLVKAVSFGSAEITATTYNGKTETITLTAVHAPESIRFEQSAYSVAEGGSVRTAVVFEPDGSTGKVTYAISGSDQAIATVDAFTGEVFGKTSGSATLTASVKDNETGKTVSATAQITVTGAPVDIVINGRTEIGVGETVDLMPVAYDGHGNEIATTFKYASSSAAKAKVVNGTHIRGMARGTADIKITAANGAEIIVKMVVNNAPSVIRLKDSDLDLSVGDTYLIEHSYNANQTGAVSYLISDESVVKVDENGLLTALKDGSAVITVKTFNNKTAKLNVTVTTSPTALSFADSEIKIVMGGSARLQAIFAPEGSKAKLSFTSSDESIIAVNEDGLITAKHLGSATVTAKAYSNALGRELSAAVKVEVVKFPAAVEPDESELTLGAGMIVELSAKAFDANHNEVNSEFTLSTSNKNIVAVNGMSIKAVKSGKADITVTAPGGSSAVVSITVMNAPSGIKLDKEVTMAKGETYQLTPIFNNNQFGSVTWTVNDESIATVDEQGNVTAHKAGTATITVTTFNKKSAKCTLKVVAAPTGIAFAQSAYTLSEDETISTFVTLTPEGSFARPVYTISDEEVAKVDENGKVTGLLEGKTTLTATVHNAETGMDYTASCDITVEPAAVTIAIGQTRTRIGVGETFDLMPVAYDRSGNVVKTSFTLKSANTRKILVNGTEVRGVGTVKRVIVTVSADNGASLEVEMSVVSAPSKIALSADSQNIALGHALKLKADVNNIPEAPIKWTSSNEAVATVSESGTVTAVGLGEVTITAATYNNKKATIKMKVVPEADSLAFTEDTVKVGLGSSQSVKATIPEGTAANVIYASCNPYVARVNPTTGEVTGIKVGSTRIVATFKNAQSGKYLTAAYTVVITPVPASIRFNSDRRELGSKETLDLNPVALDADGNETGSTFTFKSSNTGVLNVNSEGSVKAGKTGTAKITVTAYNGVSEVVTIRVVAAPTGVKLDQSEVNVVIGQTSFTPAVTLNPKAAVSKMTWTSEDESIAVVDESGRITGVAYGTTRIKASTYNNKSAVLTVHVFNAPSEILLSNEELSLGEGQSHTLTHSFKEGEYSLLTFVSSNATVATVDANGKVSALKTGTTTITATAVNGVKAECAVTVKSAPASVKFTENSIEIGVGQVFNANDYVVLPEGTQASFTFKPESSRILEDKGDGMIRGKAVGTTRLKVTTHNGKTAMMTVKVLKAATNIKLEKSTEVVYVGSIFEITPVFPANTTALVTFTSDNEEVINITSDGTAKALSAGTANITATAHNGTKVVSTITVYRHVESVTLSDSALTLVHYDSATLEATILPEGVFDDSLTWTSSDSEKVSVDENGKITALNITSSPVTITATSNDTGISATCKVSVTPVRLTDMALSLSEVTLENGRSVKAEVSFTPGNADDKSVKWTSSNTKVATVDSEGTITAVASSGTAVISCVSTDGNITKTITVTAEKVHLVGAALEQSEITVTHYDEADIIYTLDPFDADIASANWTVSDPAIASVVGGHLKALSVGKTKVNLTLTDTFGFSVSFSLNVTVEPVRVTSVALNQSEIHLRIDRSGTVEVSVYPENADNKAVDWTIRDKTIATLEPNEDGALVLAGKKAGETTIIATSKDGGFTDECLVKVFEPLEVEPQPNFTHNTPGNDIVFKLVNHNAIGEVKYSIKVFKDGAQILSAATYDSDKGIVISSCAKGTYTLSVSVTDGEGDQASAECAVIVDDTFTYTERNITWEYRIVSAQGESGAAVKLVSCPSGTTSITVPATMDGAKVVRIDTEAFMNQTGLKHVSIPETVTEIGARAFKGCTNLSELTNY